MYPLIINNHKNLFQFNGQILFMVKYGTLALYLFHFSKIENRKKSVRQISRFPRSLLYYYHHLVHIMTITAQVIFIQFQFKSKAHELQMFHNTDSCY